MPREDGPEFVDRRASRSRKHHAEKSNCVQTFVKSSVVDGADQTQVRTDGTAATAEPKHDKFAVDVVAVYVSGGKTEAEQRAIFDSKRQSTPQKLTKSGPSESTSVKSQAQQTDTSQGKTDNAAGASQHRKVNWLVDKDMIRSYVPVAHTIGFSVDLTHLNALVQQDHSVSSYTSIARIIGEKLQDIRRQYGARPVVFIGHGYGTLLIETLLNEKELPDISAALQESTAAVCFFAAPVDDIAPLIDWSSRFVGLGRNAKVFSSLQIPRVSIVWQQFNIRISEWNTSTFAFRERQSAKAKEKESEESSPVKSQDEPKGSGGLEEPQSSICLADEERETNDDIDGVARMSGPRDQKFQTLMDFLVRAVRTHHLLSAAKRGDSEMIMYSADQSIDINLPNRQGETPLHVAVRYGNSDTVVALIRTGKVDLNRQDQSGKTALHCAVQYNGNLAYQIAKDLLEGGANPHLRGGEPSETPAELAESLIKKSVRGNSSGDNVEQPDNPRSRWEMTKQLLENPPPVSPPRLMKRLVKQIPAENSEARDACRKTVVVVREILETGSYIPYYTSIEQLIYGSSNADGKKPDERDPADNSLRASLDNYFRDQRKRYTSPGEPKCQWYHIPMNNVGLPSSTTIPVWPYSMLNHNLFKMAWIHDLFAALDYHVWPWPQGYRDFSLPHSRTVYPQVAQLKPLGEKVDDNAGMKVWAVMMPYISYEEHDRQTKINEFVKKVGRQHRQHASRWERRLMLRHLRRSRGGGNWFWRLAGVSSHDYRRWPWRKGIWGEENEQRLSKGGTFGAITAYLNYKHSTEYARDLPLHPRRTLDQSYYYMLNDTSFRDKTQVVSRWFRKANTNKTLQFLWADEKKSHNILMVDQLWLWIIERPGEPDTLITSFPDRHGATPSAVDDIQKQVLDEPTGDPSDATGNLAGQILAVCCSTLNPNQDVESVKFLQLFENSIAHVEEKASRLFQEFRLLSTLLQGLDKGHAQYQEQRRHLLADLLHTSEELKPLTEVKDILDEIKIIQTTLEDQAAVINSSQIREVRPPRSSDTWYTKAQDILFRTTRSFETLKARAEAVEKSIEHLLDLKQKQANLWEARTSREGADETAKQGNTLLVFTVVTIIFVRPNCPRIGLCFSKKCLISNKLPLSFLSSFFGLDIDSFPKDTEGHTSWPLKRICGLLFGISFAVSIPFILLAFLIEFLKSGLSQLRHFWIKILLLPVLHLLSKVPFLSDISDSWWIRVDRSARQYCPGYGSRVRTLLSRGDTGEIDDDIYYLFHKRLRRFMMPERPGYVDSDWDSDSDEGDLGF